MREPTKNPTEVRWGRGIAVPKESWPIDQDAANLQERG